MGNLTQERPSETVWFVGAAYGGTDDQLPRFLADGIWENGWEDKYHDQVRAMRPGERIAVKASYTRLHKLPFDNRNNPVSVMAIKATGIIEENLNDGRRVRVAWNKPAPLREWYFYTNRLTVWRVRPGEWMADGLIAFAFDSKPQDIDRYRNAPYWKDRFGTTTGEGSRFGWTRFYDAIADSLLAYQYDRSGLVSGLKEIASRVEGLRHLSEDHYKNGETGFVRDICPFTTMGVF